MTEQEQAKKEHITMWGVDRVVIETALYNAFIDHAIDNRGILTSPRRGEDVTAQILTAVEQFLAHEADNSDIMVLTTQLSEEGMAIITGSQMMRSLNQFGQGLTDTAVIHRFNDFQILFLAELANAVQYFQLMCPLLCFI